MSNGQEEIARLEAATEAFEQIITTEESSVEVPNIGPTPSLKKRIDDRFNEQFSGPVMYMQSANSDVDEHGYPLRTLYKNGDGMTVYYPEYSVFRKDGGGWKRIDPHVRNVANFNGTTQYAVIQNLEELELDSPSLGFEVEWYGMLNSGRSVLSYMIDDGRENNFNSGLLTIYRYLNTVYVGIGGRSNTMTVGDLIPVDSLKPKYYSISLKDGTLSLKEDGKVLVSRGNVIVGNDRPTPETVCELARTRTSSGSTGLYYKGQLSNIKIWTGGDRNTGTLVRDYRMDEGWNSNSLVLKNYAAELGEELVINGAFDTDLNGWEISGASEDGSVEWSNGAAHMISSGPSGLLFQQFSLTADTHYIWTASFDVNSGSIVWGQEVLGTQMSVGISESGSYERVAKSVSSRLSFKRSTSGTDVLIDNVSVRQADGYGTYVGFTEASWTEETV